jgi:hypothetical protein
MDTLRTMTTMQIQLQLQLNKLIIIKILKTNCNEIRNTMNWCTHISPWLSLHSTSLHLLTLHILTIIYFPSLHFISWTSWTAVKLMTSITMASFPWQPQCTLVRVVVQRAKEPLSLSVNRLLRVFTNQNWIMLIYFSNTKFYELSKKIHLVGAELFHADGRTDRHDATNKFFVIFTNTHKTAYLMHVIGRKW